MKVTAIGWAGLVVEDYQLTLRFFTDTLRLSLAHEYKKSQIAHFRLPSGQLLEIYGPGNRQRRPEKFGLFDGYALGFEVDNLEAYHQQMVQQGVRFIGGIETWQDEAWAMFFGPENRLLQIQTAGRRPSSGDGFISNLSWAGMAVKDLNQAVDFFTHSMKMRQDNDSDYPESALISLPGGHIFEILGPSHPWADHLGKLSIGFQVADMATVVAALSDAGVEFMTGLRTAPDGRTATFFRGPDASVYALRAPAP